MQKFEAKLRSAITNGHRLDAARRETLQRVAREFILRERAQDDVPITTWMRLPVLWSGRSSARMATDIDPATESVGITKQALMR